MNCLYLNRADIESLEVGIRDVVVALDEVFRLKGMGKTEMPPKVGVHTMPDSFIHAMPAHVPNIATGMKRVSGYPSNIEKGLPYITGLLILNDPSTGIPIAIMDCAWITAMRTGASAAISAKYLARPNSRVAAFLGCGVQARTSLKALIEVQPTLQVIHCCDLFEEATRKFVDDMSTCYQRLQFKVFKQAEAMAHDADIVLTAIPIVANPEPPLDAGMLREGALAISLDYDSAWTSAAMCECTFISDDIPQLLATKEHGPFFTGIPHTIHADLGDLAAGTKRGRSHEQERIFSMNMGIAVDDMATAKLLFDVARRRNVGTTLLL